LHPDILEEFTVLLLQTLAGFNGYGSGKGRKVVKGMSKWVA